MTELNFGPRDFDSLYNQAVALQAHHRPVDVTHEIGRAYVHGRAEIAVELRPPKIVYTEYDFIDTSRGTFRDKVVTTLSLGEDGKPEVIEKEENQDRGGEGKPALRWSGPLEKKLGGIGVHLVLREITTALAKKTEAEAKLQVQ